LATFHDEIGNRMTETNQKHLGSTVWKIAADLRGLRNGRGFQDCRLSFLFPHPVSDSCETAAKRGLMQQLFPTHGVEE
jgi:type I restriction enzyme M protein